MKRKSLLKSAICLLSMLGLAACGETSATSSATAPTSEVKEEKFTVSFQYNYADAGVYQTAEVKKGEKVAKPEDPSRTDYTFLSWTTDANGEAEYDFNLSVEADLTLYAQWIDGNTTLYTVTYHYDYDDKETTQKVTEGKRLTTTSPEREDYTFMGWHTDAAYANKFSNGTKINQNTDLYAKWGKTYVMEAEYVDLSSFHGQGFSGGCDGAQAISQDKAGLGASNGVFLTYMYNNGLSISFDFTSTGAESSAMLYLRLSCEKMDIVMKSAEFSVTLNGQPISYGDISMTQDQPFTDYLITDHALINDGKNTLTLTTTNSVAMAGTMYSTAPIIDCAKFVSSTELVMDAHTSNMDKFNMD